MYEEGASGDAVTSRIYRDEPIPRTAALLAGATPPEYREMRKLARSYSIYENSEAIIFYKQGKFMEEFEDDFDFGGEFVRYFPTYQAMNDRSSAAISPGEPGSGAASSKKLRSRSLSSTSMSC